MRASSDEQQVQPMAMESKVTTTGLALPPVAGVQLALYCDRNRAGFWPARPWRDEWGCGRVQVLGVDTGAVRLRLVVERLRPGLRTEWGLV